MAGFTCQQIAKMIDHSLLQPQLTDNELDQGCKLAREYDVATACVKPYAIQVANEVLAGSDVKVCAVDATWSGLKLVIRVELRREVPMR